MGFRGILKRISQSAAKHSRQPGSFTVQATTGASSEPAPGWHGGVRSERLATKAAQEAPAANGKGCGELKEKSSAVPGDAMVPPPARSDKRGFVSSIRTGLAKVAAAALGNRPQAAPRQKGRQAPALPNRGASGQAHATHNTADLMKADREPKRKLLEQIQWQPKTRPAFNRHHATYSSRNTSSHVQRCMKSPYKRGATLQKRDQQQ